MTLWAEACAPLAVRASEWGEFEASLRKVMVPEEAPSFCGAKVTLNGTLCPAAMVTGNVTPLTE